MVNDPAACSSAAQRLTERARWVSALFAVDPQGLGVAVRAAPGPARDRWLADLRSLLPTGVPVRRIPLHISDERLLGGLDLGATLQAGRPVVQGGVLIDANGGVIVLTMAERVTLSTAGRLSAVMDRHELVNEREGFSACVPCCVGVIAFDEGLTCEEGVPPRLSERLAFHLTLDELPDSADDFSTGTGTHATDDLRFVPAQVAQARSRAAAVHVPDAMISALCAAAWQMGVESIRAPMFALGATRAIAALLDHDEATADDAELAAQLVLAPRATRNSEPSSTSGEDTAPANPTQAAASTEPAQGTPPASAIRDATTPESVDDDPHDSGSPGATKQPVQALQERLVAAALACVPRGLLAATAELPGNQRPGFSAGRAGPLQGEGIRGTPIGVRQAAPTRNARLNLVATLRAAAPWQTVRRQQASPACSSRIHVRRSDFHVSRCRRKSETTTVFVVDASGSSALHRLAEMKGAVELLLSECYARRDNVAVVAFRGRGAELLLPPTRSLVRAKRSLAGLPGGGATPLAAGIDATRLLAEGIRRRAQVPVLVFLTDGRGNIARNGSADRALAIADAFQAASQLRAARVDTLLLDTSTHTKPEAQRLACAMGARYVPLPHADASSLMQAVVQAGRDRSAEL